MLQDNMTSEKNAFLAHCQQVRGLSNNSVYAYEQDVAAFVAFTQRGDHKYELNSQAVLNYLDHLKRERNYRHATICRRLVTLRAFANWLLKAGHLGEDPLPSSKLTSDRLNASPVLSSGLMSNDVERIWRRSFHGFIRHNHIFQRTSYVTKNNRTGDQDHGIDGSARWGTNTDQAFEHIQRRLSNTYSWQG